MQSTDKETAHQGRNVKQLRELLGIKQETLAFELGEDWNQKRVSILEQKDVIDDTLLEQISKIFKIPVDAIKNFDLNDTVYNIQNNYEGSNTGVNSAAFSSNHHCTFNPLDKLMATVEQNKKLYERLLASEKEKNELLQKILDSK